MFFNRVAGDLQIDIEMLVDRLRARWEHVRVSDTDGGPFTCQISVEPSDEPSFTVSLSPNMFATDATPGQQAMLAEELRASMPVRIEVPVWMTNKDTSRKRELPANIKAGEVWVNESWSDMTDDDFAQLP